jgi:serine/threonine protein kinase
MKVIMLTVNNPEPTLDKTKYKRYSREFRKMIERCLNKDPTERPSAKELLKGRFLERDVDFYRISLARKGRSINFRISFNSREKLK